MRTVKWLATPKVRPSDLVWVMPSATRLANLYSMRDSVLGMQSPKDHCNLLQYILGHPQRLDRLQLVPMWAMLWDLH